MTTISGVAIGEGQPCRVICEVSNNHNGRFENAVRLIEGAASAGADFVKFQCFDVEELVALRGDGPAPEPWGSMGWGVRDLYAKAQTPFAWFPDLIRTCERVGVPWFSSVFGRESLRLLRDLGCPAFKVAALDVTEVPGDWFDIDETVIASSRGERIPWADLTLYCPPGYPQDWSWGSDVTGHLAGISALDGVSYHGSSLPRPALTTGHMIEVHVQLDDEPSELESNVSLTISQLRQLVDMAKTARRVA